MNWDSAMGDVLLVIIGTFVFVFGCLIIGKLKGEW